MKKTFKELPQLTRSEAGTVERMLLSGITEKFYRSGVNVVRIAIQNRTGRVADVAVTYFDKSGGEINKTVCIKIAKGL